MVASRDFVETYNMRQINELPKGYAHRQRKDTNYFCEKTDYNLTGFSLAGLVIIIMAAVISFL